MRKQLLASLRRSQRLAKVNASRGFSSSVARPAEVELTVDGYVRKLSSSSEGQC